MKARRALPWYLWVLLAGGLLTLAPLWMPLLLAAWFARLVQPIVDGLSRKLGSRHPGIILSLGLFVLMIVPVTAAVAQLIVAGSDLFTNVMSNKEWRGALESLVNDSTGAEHSSAAQLLNPERILQVLRDHGAAAFGILKTVFGATTAAVIALFIFFLSCYHFLHDGPKYWAWMRDHAPVEPKALDRFANAFHETGRGLIIGVGLTCLTQAIVATIAYAALGIPRALLLGELTFFAAFVPSFGTALLWVPVAVGLALTGAYVKAGILAGIGILVVGTIDNLLSPMFSRWGKLDLPVYVLVVSIFGGFAVFGAWGFVMGPLTIRLAKEALILAKEPEEA